jgi:hypothetical protein
MMLAKERAIQPFTIIPSGDVTFHPHSFADDAGRLFWWNAQLYRGINAAHASFFNRLFRDGVIQQLVESGLLIDSEPVDLVIDQYPMIVKHRTVPFVSYPNEWCAAMLKDAALTIIDLATELARLGLTLKDAHPWNLLFDCSRPVYVDLTSIVPQKGEPEWSAYDEFCRFCYYPLILMAHGQERIARTLLPEYDGVTRRDLLTIMRGCAPSRFVFSKLLDRVLKSARFFFRRAQRGSPSGVEFLEKVRRDLEKIPLPTYESRGRDHTSTLASETDVMATRQTFREIITRLRPDALLDLSCDETWTSVLPASLGINVASMSADPARATAIYEMARDKKLPILPLVMDFVKPTPSVGYSDHYSIGATERFRCEMVAALGLADKLATENHFNLDLVAEGLSAFAKRWLIVDFGGSQSSNFDEERDGRATPHSLDDFIHALCKRFGVVRVLSATGNGRALLMCERRSGER